MVNKLIFKLKKVLIFDLFKKIELNVRVTNL